MDISLQETKRYREGVWFDEGGEHFKGDPDEVKEPVFLIARDQNKKYLAALEAERKKFKAKLRKDNLSMEENLEIAARAIGRAIVLDWRNVKNEKTRETVEATQENRVLAMRLNPTFKEFVTACSSSFEVFGEAEREAQAGKSQPGSSGTGSTTPKIVEG